MMAGFQAEENLTGRAQKNVRKILDVILVLGGDGIFFIDGEELPIKAGSCFRVDPAGRRCLKAGKNGLRYLCIQSARNSLKGFTMTDGVVEEGAKAPKPSWM